MRLFIAIDAPPWIKRGLYSTQEDGLWMEGLRRTESANMHITLKFLGDASTKELQRTMDSLSRVRHNDFEIVVRGVGAFPSEKFVKVVWAGCKGRGLETLARKIEDALPWFPRNGEDFMPHITLARVEKRVRLDDFFEKYSRWRYGDFKAGKFMLMASELTSRVPKYIVVAEYPLDESKDEVH